MWSRNQAILAFMFAGCLLVVGGYLAYQMAMQSKPLAIVNPIVPGSELSRLMHEARNASRSDDHKRAAELYTQALAIEPGPNVISQDLHAMRGSEYNYLDMPKQALADYDAALKFGYPSMSTAAIRAHMGRGYALITLEQYGLAKADFDVVLEHIPNEVPRSSSTLAWRGAAYQGLGDRERAVADYKAALALDPSNTRARDGLADLENP